MRLVVLVVIAMVAFAANSLLNRMAVAQFGLDPMVFAVVRVGAGSVMLGLLLRGTSPEWNWRGAAALAIYMVGFSWAYLNLGAGVGALILFGTIQMVMFGWAVRQGQNVPFVRWVGALIALIGLAVLLWPKSGGETSSLGALAMIVAGIGWAAYTLLGKGADNALAATAGNFIMCVPLMIGLLMLGWSGEILWQGLALAAIAGALTSGLGYALWYRVLPQLQVTVAATVQLSVPVIAVLAGAVLLGEAITLRVLIAGALVLGGIAVSLAQDRF